MHLRMEIHRLLPSIRKRILISGIQKYVSYVLLGTIVRFNSVKFYSGSLKHFDSQKYEIAFKNKNKDISYRKDFPKFKLILTLHKLGSIECNLQFSQLNY